MGRYLSTTVKLMAGRILLFGMNQNQIQRKQEDINRELNSTVILDIMEPSKAYLTSEIAKTIGWSREVTYKALNDLAKRGRIQERSPRARRVFWVYEPAQEQS